MKWHSRFLGLASHIAQWSNDEDHKVGAVIVDSNNRIVSTGYNGPVSKVNLLGIDKCAVLHAEVNAVLNSLGRSLEGCKLYVVPLFPCVRCATIIAQVGIKEVHFVDKGTSQKHMPDLAKTVFAEKGVITHAYTVEYKNVS